MKEFVEKLIGRLEELQNDKYYDGSDRFSAMEKLVFDICIEYINHLAEECKPQLNDNDLMIVESLPSLYPMKEFEEKALKRVIGCAKKEYNNGWVPCSERLPEKYGEYLCCDTYGNFILGFPSESDTSDTGFIVETEHEYCYDIIAWMELPEKYKEKNNGSS